MVSHDLGEKRGGYDQRLWGIVLGDITVLLNRAIPSKARPGLPSFDLFHAAAERFALSVIDIGLKADE